MSRPLSGPGSRAPSSLSSGPPLVSTTTLARRTRHSTLTPISRAIRTIAMEPLSTPADVKAKSPQEEKIQFEPRVARTVRSSVLLQDRQAASPWRHHSIARRQHEPRAVASAVKKGGAEFVL
jgi:hypothetical protein